MIAWSSLIVALSPVVLLIVVIVAPAVIRMLGLPARPDAPPAPANATPADPAASPTSASPATPTTIAPTPIVVNFAPASAPMPAPWGRASRIALPMSSGVNVLPNDTVQVTSRPQNVAFRPERIVIGGNPSDWVVNDIKIGNQSQFSQDGEIPGECFSADVDAFVSFNVCPPLRDFVVIATYVGDHPDGEPFVCSAIGTAEDAMATVPAKSAPLPRPRPRNDYFLPLGSGVKVLPNTSAQITAHPQVDAFCCDRILIGGVPGDWIINDIKIGDRSQLAQSGDLPGEMFSAFANDATLALEQMSAGMNFVVLVTYIGKEEAGAAFEAVALGRVGHEPRLTDRILLPMSSGVNILPNTSAQITSRPQNIAFRPERIVLGGTPNDWVINDVKVGNRSQMAQTGDCPGVMFSATSTLRAFTLETIQTAVDFVLLVTYVGANPTGAPFVCGVIGTAAI